MNIPLASHKSHVLLFCPILYSEVSLVGTSREFQIFLKTPHNRICTKLYNKCKTWFCASKKIKIKLTKKLGLWTLNFFTASFFNCFEDWVDIEFEKSLWHWSINVWLFVCHEKDDREFFFEIWTQMICN